MRKSTRLGSALTVVAGLSFLLPVSASAQGWLEDRARTQGPGIRLGDFELHPGIGLELGWDSNVYYTEDNPDPATGVAHVDSAILRVTPHLLFSTRTAERREEGEQQGEQLPPVQFSGGLSASYYEFFADESRRNVSIDAGLRLVLFQGQPFSIAVYDQFSRGIRPFTENLREATFARINNDAGLDLTFSTHGGVLQFGTGYRFGLDFFEEGQLSYANSFNHQISLREAFRFLPQTAIVHETHVQIRDYFDPPPPGTADRPLVLDGVRVSSMIGLNGAVTPEVSFLALVGYGAGFFEPRPGYQQDYDAFLARAELRWRPQENLRFAVGYDRSANPSFIGNYYTQDRGYLNTQLMFGGVFLLGAEGSVGYYDFGQIVAADGMTMIGNSTERNDIRVIASLFGEYRFTEWLGINGTVRYTGNFTDFQYLRGAGILGIQPDPAQFNKVELWLGVRVFY